MHNVINIKVHIGKWKFSAFLNRRSEELHNHCVRKCVPLNVFFFMNKYYGCADLNDDSLQYIYQIKCSAVRVEYFERGWIKYKKVLLFCGESSLMERILIQNILKTLYRRQRYKIEGVGKCYFI